LETPLDLKFGAPDPTPKPLPGETVEWFRVIASY